MDPNFSLEYLDNLLCNLDSITKKIKLIQFFYEQEYEEPYKDYLIQYDYEYYREEKEIHKKYKKEHSKLDLKSISIDKSFEIKKHFLDDPLYKIYEKYSNLVENIRIELQLRFFGEGEPVHKIFPQTIFIKHFPDSSSCAEFCYWLLNEEAEKYFFWEKLSIDKFLFSAKSTLYLKTKLQEIIEFENRVDQLIEKKGLNSYSNDKEYIEEIEYLRIIDGFYSSYVWNPEKDTHKVKVKYILLKEYLLSKINPSELANNKNKLDGDNYLRTPFTKETLVCLFNKLIEGETPFFHPESDRNSFLYAFGAIENIEDFIPLVWVKTQEQKKTKEVNIRSFIDLLTLLEIDYSNPDNKKLIGKLFKKKNKNGEINPMKFQPKHFELNSKTRQRKTSEFFDILQNMIIRCKSMISNM